MVTAAAWPLQTVASLNSTANVMPIKPNSVALYILFILLRNFVYNFWDYQDIFHFRYSMPSRLESNFCL